MENRDRELIDRMMKDKNLNQLQAMILLILYDDHRAHPDGQGMTEEEISIALEARFTDEELNAAEFNSEPKNNN